MASSADAPHSSFARCNCCRKEATPARRIRACTRCHAVGYCSKLCQRRDWAGREGHKARCRPRPADGAVDAPPKDDTNDKPPPIGNVENGEVRLEVKRDSGNGEEMWEDAGPINLVDGMGKATITPQLDGGVPSIPGTTATTNHIKELSAATQRILGPPPSNNYTYRHSPDGVDDNLLIFFHGAGDAHLPYDNLGKKMQLPQTATLSISASISLNLDHGTGSSEVAQFVELPFGLGHTWFEEMDYQTTGETLPKDHPRRLKSLKHAIDSLYPLVCSLTGLDSEDDTAGDDTWIPERIFLFGFSAGASLVMEMCRTWASARRMPLGGVICIAGGICTKDSVYAKNQRKPTQQAKPTDVLIIAGSNDTVYPKEAALLSKQYYPNCTIHVQKGKGHSMIESSEEMRAVMEFLSKRLVRRMVSMGGHRGG